MIPEYLTGSHREGIEVPFRPFLFLIHVTLRCWLNAFHNANNWLRPLLWHYVPNINTLQRALAPLPRPIVAPSSLLGCLINVHQLFFHFYFFFFFWMFFYFCLSWSPVQWFVDCYLIKLYFSWENNGP